MKGKFVSLLCKIIGLAYAVAATFYYLNRSAPDVKADVLLAIAGVAVIIANLAFPVDISKIITNWKDPKGGNP